MEGEEDSKDFSSRCQGQQYGWQGDGKIRVRRNTEGMKERCNSISPDIVSAGIALLGSKN